MFFTWAQAFEYVYNFSWPFDTARQACPSEDYSFWIPAIPQNEAFLGKYVFEYYGVTSCNGVYKGNKLSKQE